MAKRLIVTFNEVITQEGFLDLTDTLTLSFIFGVPTNQNEVQIKETVSEQITEFIAVAENLPIDLEYLTRDNEVYVNDLIDDAPIFTGLSTDLNGVVLFTENIEDYGIIYTIEYYDIKDVFNKITIGQKGYYGFNNLVTGYGILKKTSFEDVNNNIISSGLTIVLDADTSLTYDNLYSEDDRTFLIKYDRAEQREFNGWLTPEGYYEDYVSDKWQISLECVDGLAFLEDLSYVDENGLFYTGKQSQLEIITNCLNRIGIIKNINTNIDIFYNGLDESLDILPNVYYNSDRFVKDDGDTIMSCQEVLEDVLSIYNATITSYKGEWFIYKLNNFYNNLTYDYFRYDNLGNALTPAKGNLDIEFNLGSEIDGFYPHHINSNQSLSNRRSIGAHRISYKYGLDKSLLDNTRLYYNGTDTEDWTVNNGTVVDITSGDYGFNLNNNDTIILGATADSVNLSVEDVITYNVSFATFENSIRFNSVLTLTDGVDTYYLGRSGVWVTSLTYLGIDNKKRVIDPEFPEQLYVGTGAFINFSITSEPLPISGDLTIEFYSSRVDQNGLNNSGYVTVSEVSISAEQTATGIVGEFHTVQRESNPSANVEDNNEVNVGDNPSDLYLGTIYTNDATTPTSLWNRKGVVEEKPILQITGEELLRLNAKTSKTFSGDCYGYIPYISIITINNRNGLFVPIQYSYNTLTNVTQLKSKEIFGDELLDIKYDLTYDYGNVVEPTIKG